MGQRLEIDRIRCDGYGMCAEMFPEGIELDEWGYPILRPRVIPDGLVPLARRAAEVCPVLALRLATKSSGPPSVRMGRPVFVEPASRT